jgi:hypothetical protein
MIGMGRASVWMAAGAALGLWLPRESGAWGPHTEITQAAMNALPPAERAFFTNFVPPAISWMGEYRGDEPWDYYPEDYLYTRFTPRLPADPMNAFDYSGLVAGYFERALQALRTETPAEAARHLGACLHFLEDAGSPPHAYWMAEVSAPHRVMEDCLGRTNLTIAGYAPKPLGRNDVLARWGVWQRVLEQHTASKALGERLLPVVTNALARTGEWSDEARLAKLLAPDYASRDKTEIRDGVREAALETAQAAADVLSTLYGLCREWRRPDGAGLEGQVGWAALDYECHAKKGARLVLLDDALYGVLAARPEREALFKSGTEYSTFTDPAGRYAFRNLPPGRYRVLGYRVGSRPVISDTVVLKGGEVAKLDLALPATEPAGNIVVNPEFRIYRVRREAPDYWGYRPGNPPADKDPVSLRILILSNRIVQCGAVLKDPATRVRFEFSGDTGGAGPALILGPNTYGSVDKLWGPAARDTWATITVETTRPPGDVVERVWMVPEKKSP